MFLTLIPKYVLLKIPKHKTHEISKSKLSLSRKLSMHVYRTNLTYIKSCKLVLI